MANKIKALVDSAFILPAFNIGVKALTLRDLENLDRLYRLGIVEFYYTDIVWVEIIPKIIREYRRRNMKLPLSRIIEVVSVLRKTFEHVKVDEHAVAEAFKLKQLGHPDMIDNILYGIALRNNMYLLTLDLEFRNFLKKHNLKYNMLITHQELFGKIERQDFKSY